MLPVAEGFVGGVFAAAEINLFGFGYLGFYRGEAASFVGAVAEGLLCRLSAGAPPISAGLHFYRIRCLLNYYRLHLYSLLD